MKIKSIAIARKLLLLLLFCAGFITNANANQIEFEEYMEELPYSIENDLTQDSAHLVYRKIWHWKEANGSRSFALLGDDRYGSHIKARLYNNASGRFKKLREINDTASSLPCDGFIGMSYNVVDVTDIDNNGQSEFSFMYEMGCSEQSGPLTRKLLFLEGSTKYILRGKSQIEVNGSIIGGDYQMEGFDGNPLIKRHAAAKWEEYLEWQPAG